MGTSFSFVGDLSDTEKWLRGLSEVKILAKLNSIAAKGVIDLTRATPKDTGNTASKWSYEIKKVKSGYEISWTNSAAADDVPIVILIQYGHGTGTGGYVQGNDFINPVMKPIFDSISSEIGKAVRSR